jgi:hypothetical protein
MHGPPVLAHRTYASRVHKRSVRAEARVGCTTRVSELHCAPRRGDLEKEKKSVSLALLKTRGG